MNKRGQPFSDKNAWVYLANNGPSASDELPNHPKIRDRQEGVRKFNLTARTTGSSLSGGWIKTPVYYIDGKHTPESVVDAWVEHNQASVEQLPGDALYRRCPKEFRPALQDQLDITFNPRGGEWEPGGICPLCDEEYSRQLPDHLPDCEKQ